MFNRFTAEAREVVVEARVHALRLSHRHIGTEHVLLALLSADPLTSGSFAQAGVSIKNIELELSPSDSEEDLTIESGLESDREPLADLGIDLGDVQNIVESTFGHRALDRARSSRSDRRWWRRRNRPCADTIRFTASSKQALEGSLREAMRLKHRRIGPEHIALGLLQVEDGLAYRILRRQGVAMKRLRASLEHLPGRAA